MEKIQPVIQIEHLSKHFSINNGFFSKGKKTVKAVNDFTLNLEKGKILGLVGESGSEKLLWRAILNLTSATEGTVLINGIDMSKCSAAEKKELRKNIAVVFQDPLIKSQIRAKR